MRHWGRNFPECHGSYSNSPESFARGQKREEHLCWVIVIVPDALCLSEPACSIDGSNCW